MVRALPIASVCVHENTWPSLCPGRVRYLFICIYVYMYIYIYREIYIYNI